MGMNPQCGVFSAVMNVNFPPTISCIMHNLSFFYLQVEIVKDPCQMDQAIICEIKRYLNLTLDNLRPKLTQSVCVTYTQIGQ